MLSTVRDFLNRHGRKFFIGGLVVSGTVFIIHYTQRKLREYEGKEVRKMFERIKRRQYYESNERTCNQMISSLAVTLRDSVISVLNTENFVNDLRNKSCNKIATWNELKAIVIARSAVIIYSHVMLVILLRIQVNLMSGYMYKDTEDTESKIKDVQKQYMSLSGYFMKDGVQELCTLIRNKVREITSSVSLKDELTLRDVEQIYWTVVSSVSADTAKDPIKNLSQYVLAPTSERLSDPVLKKMVNETLDLFDSEEVQNLLRSCINNGFVLLIDHISEYFVPSPKVAKEASSQNGITIQDTTDIATTSMNNSSDCNLNSSFIDFNTATMPMAKIIPIINGQIRANPMPKDVSSDWLQRLLLNDDLKTLGANVFEAFSF